MGRQKKAFNRYHLIDDLLTSVKSPYPNLPRIIEYVNAYFNEFYEEEISKRAIQRDLQDMRESSELGYFAPIKYSTTHRGYYYEEEDFTIKKLPLKQEERKVIEWVANMLARYENIPVFSNFKHITQKIFDALNIQSVVEKNEKMESAIQFDQHPNSAGSHWLIPITEALQDYRKIEIAYQPYGQDQPYDRVVYPYILKEFKGRWYLIGISESATAMRTYALDRIVRLRKKENTFPFNPSFDCQKYFEHSFGIYNLSQEDPQEIRLKFSQRQGNYVMSRPIHPTQKLIEKDDKSITISLQLYISEDFKMELFSYGEQLTVLSPPSLIQEIKDRLQLMQNNYLL